MRPVMRRARTREDTLRALIERGLRLALRADRHPRQFELRDASAGGRGLQSPYRDGDWARVRDAIYEDRGG